MKLTLADTKLLIDAVSIISELVTEARFSITKEAMELVALDPATVAMVDFKLLSTAFAEYEVAEETHIAINLTNFKQVLRRAGSASTLTLEDDDGKLKITLQGSSKRTFHLPLIDVEASKRDVPDINFSATVTTLGAQLSDAIEDAGIVAESVAFVAQENAFSVLAEGDLSKAQISIDQSSDTKIVVKETVDGESVEQPVKSRYSIEYLKKMVTAAKLSSNVTIKFRKDFPLRLEYIMLNKVQLAFILAPRVEND